MLIKPDLSVPLSDLDIVSSTMMWFQIQLTISAHHVPRKLDVPQRNICPLPSAESKEAHRNHKQQQQQLQIFNHLQDLRLSWNFVFSARNLHWLGFFYFVLRPRALCSPSSLAPKHIWLALLLFKSSAVGRRRVARVQPAQLPQLVCE